MDPQNKRDKWCSPNLRLKAWKPPGQPLVQVCIQVSQDFESDVHGWWQQQKPHPLKGWMCINISFSLPFFILSKLPANWVGCPCSDWVFPTQFTWLICQSSLETPSQTHPKLYFMHFLGVLNTVRLTTKINDHVLLPAGNLINTVWPVSSINTWFHIIYPSPQRESGGTTFQIKTKFTNYEVIKRNL